MAPTDSSIIADSQSHGFQLKCSLTANNLFPVHQYVSNKTGLTVVVAEVEGPVVDGFFCLATEAEDDDGLPHTLEHVIFLGSELYPYKGVLDLLANRCFASGTNGWTDTDHTCYTITTAGSEGFTALLPIYLDHILYPTMTDSAFITEVHHISGEGRDGGVVYSEIQATENIGERKLNRELMRALYPAGCGYRSQTGGITANVRTSTTNEKVRAYHKEFYRPENLYIIVVGNIKPEQVLSALAPVEERILSKGPRGEFSRPWQRPVPPLTASVELDVPYPNDEEDNGLVFIAWRGPSPVHQYYKLTACSILLKYLTDTSVSPLPKEFVDVPDPYASKVWYTMVENSESALLLNFDNVPKDKLNLIKPKLDAILNSIASAEVPIDMSRLATVIHRHRLEVLSNLESSPHESIAYVVIGFMLYGNTAQDLDDRLNQVREVEKLGSEPMEFWVELLKTYLLEGSSVTGKGIPSIAEQKEMGRLEEERIARQVAELGPEGLKEKEALLAAAMAENEIPPPDELLTSVPILSADSIHFHSISSFTSDSPEMEPRFDLRQVPLYMHLDHLQTNFVYMIALMDSSSVESRLRLYLPLLLELLQESPVLRRRGGGGEEAAVLLPYQEVVAQLEADTISTVFRVGLDSATRFFAGKFSSTVVLLLQVEPKKYERGIEWIRELLYQTVLTEERVKVLGAKIVNNVAEVKRKGSTMTYDLMRGLLFGKGSNHYAIEALRQYKFLSSVLAKLEQPETAREVMSDLEELRSTLTAPQNMVIHLSANLDTLTSLYTDPAGLWKKLLPPGVTPVKQRLRAIPDWKLLEEKNLNESCIAGIGSVESAFFCQTVPGISDYTHPDLPKLLVFFQYITQIEGPMWRHIRGQGLAYSYSIIPKPNEAKLILFFSRASNIIATYKEARNVLEDRLKENVTWDETLFDSAKSSLIFEIVHREKCISDVVAQSLLSYFQGVGHEYNQKLVKQIAEVQIADMKEIGPKYVAPLLDPAAVRTTAVCHTSKVKEVAQGFKGLGLNLKTFSNLDESFLNEL